MQVYFVATFWSIENIEAGKLRPLAVTSATRWEGLPEVPTLGEFIPGYEASIWMGLGAPKDTSTEIVGKLDNEINSGLTDRKLKPPLADLAAWRLLARPPTSGSSWPTKPRNGQSDEVRGH